MLRQAAGQAAQTVRAQPLQERRLRRLLLARRQILIRSSLQGVAIIFLPAAAAAAAAATAEDAAHDTEQPVTGHGVQNPEDLQQHADRR